MTGECISVQVGQMQLWQDLTTRIHNVKPEIYMDFIFLLLTYFMIYILRP